MNVEHTTNSPGRRRLAVVALIAMAMVWGSTFFSMKSLVTRIPVPDMLALRFGLAAIVLAVVGWRHLRMSRATLLQGAALGLLYGAAQIIQAYGLALTAASVSGFITGLYVVFTPLLGAIFLRDRLAPALWLAVALATAGLAVLSLDLSGGFPLGPGELLTLVSAVLYAGHIIVAGRFSTTDNAMSLTIAQTAVIAIMCLVVALPGGITVPSEPGDWALIGYLALFSGALAIYLQIWAQAIVDPTTAAVVMSTEPLWAATFAVMFGGELLSGRMLVGGSMMFAAMLFVIVIPRLITMRGRT